MKRNLAILSLSAMVSAVLGCGDGHDHDHGKSGHGAEGGKIAVAGQYKDAVAQCEDLSRKIETLISTGKLSEVHAAADDVRKIAQKLPELAQKDLPAEMLKDVNVKSKELAGMFGPIDAAADAGKKEETQKLHEKMKGLISDLKKHADHAGHKDHK